MEGQKKHFSHQHNLTIYQIPQPTTQTITWSGCNSGGNSGGTATIYYACYQCNFFLHEQCFNSPRSLHHPSHTSHPLTLLPFPTYPSNSFYCNSCNQIGTGFTYSCSDCEFDLHIQCAISLPQTHILPQQNHALNYSTPYDHYQAPIFNPQYGSVCHQEPGPFVNYPPIHHPSHNNVQTYVNNPQNFHIPSQNPTINEKVEGFNHFHNYPQHPQPVPSYPSKNETVPSLNAPMNSSQSSDVPSLNSAIKETEQKVNHVENKPQPAQNTQETAVTESKNEKSESLAGNNEEVNIQVEMQRLQLEMQMAQQMAQMMASMGSSICNLAG